MKTAKISNFESAGRQVMQYLHKHMGFNLWMITRTEGDDLIVLQTDDHGYGIKPDTVFRWDDSLCSEMIKGNGPHIAPCIDDVPAYKAAPIAKVMDIKAYVGMPLRLADGSLFGTLCAINPTPQPASIVGNEEQLQLLASLLSTILQAELKNAEEARDSERMHAEALTDMLTSLYNRRGWDQLMAAEEERCHRFGHSAAVITIDIKGLKQTQLTAGQEAADQLIERTGDVLRSAARVVDVVARLGGDEFGVLSIECDRAGADSLCLRIRTKLEEAGIKAAIGVAMREAGSGLAGAWVLADKMMHEEMRTRNQKQ